MDLYDVHKYTDEQLYDILDMNNPTDRELEAKIIQMIRKYEDIPTNTSKQLYDFFNNTKIQPTIDWMRERLILSWIEVSDKEEIDPLELEMHDYVKSNILGTKGRVNFPHNNKFTAIDWNENNILKEWLEEVKSKITSP